MFRLFKNHFQVFYSPDTPASGPSNEMGHEDMIEFLGEDDGKKEVLDIKEKTPKDETEKPASTEKSAPKNKEINLVEESDEEQEEEEDDLAELELELKGPTEEQLELVTPVRRREILSKYPNLFKDFPYLEKAYYREQQFTETFPTIEDAKMAAEKATTLDRFEGEIMGGRTESILKAVKEENPASFAKLVDDYLPTLARVDQQAFYHVLGNVTKHTIEGMVREAHKSSNEALRNAAVILNQYVFGSSEYRPPTPLAKPDDKMPDDKPDERQNQVIKTAFENTRTDLNTRVNNTLKNTIEANLDPNQSMTEFVRKHATREALDTIEELISKDSRFRALTDKLWEKAFQSNFSRESTERIKSAYLSKAKTLLPAVIKKARNEALKGMGKRANGSNDQETENKGPIPAGRPRSQSTNSGKVKSAADIPSGMSTLDFLNAD